MDIKKFAQQITDPGQEAQTTPVTSGVEEFMRYIDLNVTDVTIGIEVERPASLMSKEQNTTRPTELPFYAELSGMIPGSRSLGETGADRRKFRFVHSVPYGSTPTNVPGRFIYQRIGVYYRADKPFAFVHILDPGNKRGPSIDSDFVLSAGFVALNERELLMFERQEAGNFEVRVTEDPEEMHSWLSESAVPEFDELAQTHTKETGYTLLDNRALGKVIGTVAVVRDFAKIARNGRPAQS